MRKIDIEWVQAGIKGQHRGEYQKLPGAAATGEHSETRGRFENETTLNSNPM